MELYFIIGLVYLLLTAIVAGYHGRQLEAIDYIKDGLFWPFSLASLIGLLFKLFVTYIQTKKDKDGSKPKHNA